MITDDAKFRCAGQEMSTRIQIRETTLFAYISVASVLLGLSITRDEYTLLASFVPFAALATSLLSQYHDRVVGLLSEFQAGLEKLSDPSEESVKKGLLWHSKAGRWQEEAHRAGVVTRRIGAQGIYLVLAPAAALLIAAEGLQSPSGGVEVLSRDGIIWLSGFAATVLSASSVIGSWMGRKRQSVDGKR